VVVVTLDTEELAAALEREFGGTPGERRAVVRGARDLVDSGKALADRGQALTVREVVSNMADAPEGTSVAGRWNWWLGALEVAYGGYEQFQVRRFATE
jgi:hypothetical protein